MSLSNKSTRLPVALAAIAAIAVTVIPAAVAHADVNPISGSTAWGPCDWYTSANVRYTTTSNKTVRANLSSTGKLGVKMRTVNVNTGITSQIAYYPPLNTWQNLGSFSAKGSPFRLQFTCVNSRSKITDRPDTSFSGSLDL